jgi:hypothetical protein
MFKNFLNLGKCRLGIHEGNWSYAGQEDCTLTRICNRCGVRNSKVEHAWSDWVYLKDGSCRQGRLCSRCSAVEEAVTHRWAPPVYTRDACCDQVQACRRCGETKPSEVVHALEAWEYISPEGCEQVEVCARCQAKGAERRTFHEWGTRQAGEAGASRVCVRCRASEMQAAPAPSQAEAGVTDAERDQAFQEIEKLFSGSGGAGLFKTLRKSGTLTKLAQGATKALEVDAEARAAETLFRAEHDWRLVGHWMAIETVIGDPATANELHLIVDPEGGFERYSRVADHPDAPGSASEHGSWQTNRQSLLLTYADGTSSSERYELNGGDLVFPAAQGLSEWQRVSF